MLTFRGLTPEDHDLVLPMVQDFYLSDAVDHPVDNDILERSFRDAADPAEPLLRGLLVQWEGQPAGYIYVTQCYAAEVGGRGVQIMAWLEEEYPAAYRFRLEVTQVNQGAVRLYQNAGYQFLRYDQMILDKIK